jgi:Raf kinase inhibitor-like YbhB/YbcL family protein
LGYRPDVTPLAVLAAAFALTSPAFHPGATIPKRYTCVGANVSPPLRWTAPPRRTSSYAITMIDVSAGFLHWQAFKIPASARSLPAHATLKVTGLNSFHEPGYSGPCPPAGRAHRYVFTLRALSKTGQVLAEAKLTGRFGR